MLAFPLKAVNDHGPNMTKLLFRMRDVPEDEADEVRELLEKNAIEYFETHGGNWGISLAALWVKDAEQFARARELLDNYQSDRLSRVREEYRHAVERGEAETLWLSFLRRPFQFIAYAAMTIMVLYLSLIYFLSF